MKETLKILVINPGSTSTKIAVYSGETALFIETINHSNEEVNKFDTVQDQFLMRKDAVLKVLEDNNFNIKDLVAIVGRGGMLPPVKSGAYIVNELMVDRLKNRPVGEHASNLGAIIAYEISNYLGIPSYIYDSVAVDEMKDIARISGMPEIERISLSHALNMRAVAIKTSEKIGKPYVESNFIVAHLGGGISMSVHEKGKMVDIVGDDEGPFSPERAGRVPCRKLIELCFSGKYDKRTMHKKLRGNGGIKAYIGTHSTLEVQDRINAGDDEAALIYETMAYQVSKGIGELATVVNGEVDRIIITGGIAHSKMMTEWIKKRVEFIAPVEIMAGENELESLALGTLRVLNGEEEAREYIEE